MYVIWTKEDFKNKFILFVNNSLEEINKIFSEFIEKNKEDYEFNEELKYSENISYTKRDTYFYLSNIKNVDANEKIYILQYDESEEVGYFHHTLFELSNKKETLLEKAIELFIVDSKKTEKKDIDKMYNSLNKFGKYSIPNPRTYFTKIKIYEFIPLNELV